MSQWRPQFVHLRYETGYRSLPLNMRSDSSGIDFHQPRKVRQCGPQSGWRTSLWRIEGTVRPESIGAVERFARTTHIRIARRSEVVRVRTLGGRRGSGGLGHGGWCWGCLALLPSNAAISLKCSPIDQRRVHVIKGFLHGWSCVASTALIPEQYSAAVLAGFDLRFPVFRFTTIF